MKPFSAMYFIKENRTRSCLLIFMFVLTYITYLGGIYISNLEQMWSYSLEEYKKYAIIYPTTTDVNGEEYEKALQKIKENEKLTSFQAGVFSFLFTKTIMGFSNDFPQHSFRSVQDFQSFCEIAGIECGFSKLKKGSFITSYLGANNRGMKLGEQLKQLEDERVYGTYTLDAVLQKKGYLYYYIDNGQGGENYSYYILPKNMSEQEFEQYLQELKKEYDVHINDYVSVSQDIQRQFNSFYRIFMFIVIFLAVVMALVINAAFAGMYQHRQPEFAVYRALGMGKGDIIKKVLKELLLMDVIGLIIGGVLLFLGIYLLNYLYLIPRGWKLFYYAPYALLGMLLCNITVLVVIMITRSHQLRKVDICQY